MRKIYKAILKYTLIVSVFFTASVIFSHNAMAAGCPYCGSAVGNGVGYAGGYCASASPGCMSRSCVTTYAPTYQTCTATQVCQGDGKGCIEKSTLQPPPNGGSSGSYNPVRDDIPRNGGTNFTFNDIAPNNIPVGNRVLSNTVNTALALLTTLGTIGALVYLIYSGIRWITSGGDKEQIASAQKGITYAIIGIVVIALSAIIINIVGSLLGINYGL